MMHLKQKTLFVGAMMVLLLSGQVRAQKRHDWIKVTAENSESRVDIIATNLTSTDVYVAVDVAKSDLAPSTNLPAYMKLGPGQQRTVVTLTAVNAGKWNTAYSFVYALGSPDTKHAEDTVYDLPYWAGDTYTVCQTYGGRATHTGTLHYAVDFAMKEGTPICAAREGTVVAAEARFNKGGGTRKFSGTANYIVIRHPDRTLGSYLHLKHEGVLVQIGQRVGRGELIGYSGNTGWSTGPHLHFAVHRLFGSTVIGDTLPFKFRTDRGIITRPELGEKYYRGVPEEDSSQ